MRAPWQGRHAVQALELVVGRHPAPESFLGKLVTDVSFGGPEAIS